MLRILPGNGLQAADRSPNKMGRLLSERTHLPQDVAVGQVMKNRNPLPSHRLFHDFIGKGLPEGIVQMHPAAPFLPFPGPDGQVIIKEMNPLIAGMHAAKLLNRPLIALAGQDPEFEALAHFQDPMPAHAHLTAQIGLTGVRTDKYFHFSFHQYIFS